MVKVNLRRGTRLIDVQVIDRKPWLTADIANSLVASYVETESQYHRDTGTDTSEFFNKRAVELNLGVALLPRRCAVTEIASKRLVAIPVNGVSRKRDVTLVCRKAHRSHAADAFLKVAQPATT